MEAKAANAEEKRRREDAESKLEDARAAATQAADRARAVEKEAEDRARAVEKRAKVEVEKERAVASAQAKLLEQQKKRPTEARASAGDLRRQLRRVSTKSKPGPMRRPTNSESNATTLGREIVTLEPTRRASRRS